MTTLYRLLKKAYGEVLGGGQTSKPQSAHLVWEGSVKEEASGCMVVWRLKE